MMPAAPPTALGVNLGASLNTAALPNPMPSARKSSAVTAAARDAPARVIPRAPRPTVPRDTATTVSPPRRSEAIPPATRSRLAESAKIAVSHPACTRLAPKRSVQKVGSQTVRAMNPPKVMK